MKKRTRVTGEFTLLTGESGDIRIMFEAQDIPKEKRDLIEEAGNAFLNQAEEILNRKD